MILLHKKMGGFEMSSLNISQLKRLYDKHLPEIEREVQNLKGSSKIEKLVAIYEITSKTLYNKSITELDLKKLIIVRFIVKMLFVRLPSFMIALIPKDLTKKFRYVFLKVLIKFMEVVVSRVKGVDDKTKEVYKAMLKDGLENTISGLGTSNKAEPIYLVVPLRYFIDINSRVLLTLEGVIFYKYVVHKLPDDVRRRYRNLKFIQTTLKIVLYGFPAFVKALYDYTIRRIEDDIGYTYAHNEVAEDLLKIAKSVLRHMATINAIFNILSLILLKRYSFVALAFLEALTLSATTIVTLMTLSSVISILNLIKAIDYNYKDSFFKRTRKLLIKYDFVERIKT